MLFEQYILQCQKNELKSEASEKVQLLNAFYVVCNRTMSSITINNTFQLQYVFVSRGLCESE